MIPSGRRVFADIQDAVTRHLTMAVAAFCGCVLLGTVAIVVWPGAGLPVAVIAVVMAVIVAAVVPWLLDRRDPYFHTRLDVQETLNIPVLAVYNFQQPTTNFQGRMASGPLGVGRSQLDVDQRRRP